MSVENTEDMRALIDAAQELMDWCVIPNIDLFYESEQAVQTLCINADCMEAMSLIPDGSVDMVLCDLPYGTTACKWDSVIPFEPLWAQYKRIAKPNAAIVLFGVEPFSSCLRMSMLDIYKYDWYWNKRHGANFAQANKRPLKSIECVSVFYGAPPTYIPQKVSNPKGAETRNLYAPSRQKTAFVGQVSTTREFSTSGEKYEADKLLPKALIEFPRDSRPVHPTQKPVALMEYLIRTYTNEGETVLDNCMGSGTTGVACVNTGRRFIGIERDPGHYKMARQRVGVAANNADLF